MRQHRKRKFDLAEAFDPEMTANACHFDWMEKMVAKYPAMPSAEQVKRAIQERKVPTISPDRLLQIAQATHRIAEHRSVDKVYEWIDTVKRHKQERSVEEDDPFEWAKAMFELVRTSDRSLRYSNFDALLYHVLPDPAWKNRYFDAYGQFLPWTGYLIAMKLMDPEYRGAYVVFSCDSPKCSRLCLTEALYDLKTHRTYCRDKTECSKGISGLVPFVGVRVLQTN